MNNKRRASTKRLPILCVSFSLLLVSSSVQGGHFDASLSAELAGRVWEGDFLQVLKRTEFGVVFGGGVSFAMLNGSAFIEGRYALGLANFNKGGSFDLRSDNLVAGRFTTDPKDELKTRGILVMIGYQLPLGGE